MKKRKKKKSKKIIISASIRNVLVLPYPLPSFDKYWQAELEENPSLGELKNDVKDQPIKAGACYPCHYFLQDTLINQSKMKLF